MRRGAEPERPSRHQQIASGERVDSRGPPHLQRAVQADDEPPRAAAPTRANNCGVGEKKEPRNGNGQPDSWAQSIV